MRQPVPVSAVLLLAAIAPALAADPPVVKTRRALDHLGDAALSWHTQFNCSGCHKQSVTLEALGTARGNGYEAPAPGTVDALVSQMLSGSSGQGPDGCFSLNGQASFTVASSFGGRGLAAADRGFEAGVRANLLDAADCLLARQAVDGRLPSDHTEHPVAQGDFITTTNGVHAWLRAFERSGGASYQQAADEAVVWLRGRLGVIEASPASFTTQDKTMLLAGMAASGAGPADPDVVRARNLIAADQESDGSWMIDGNQNGGNGHGTGQAVFALRAAGYDRTDPAVNGGTQWLLDHQNPDGSWDSNDWVGGNPSDLAPSMWGALALASFDSPLNSLTASGAGTTGLSWDPVDGADAYDLARGLVSALSESGGQTDLGGVACLEPATPGTSGTDAGAPPPGDAYFYVMRIRWSAGTDIYGRSTGGRDRVPSSGDCPG